MAFVPSTYERKWPTVILTPISVANHVVTVSDTAGLHSKQKIVLSLGANQSEFEIKRVLSDTQIQVGPQGKDMAMFSNPTEYNGGTLTMSEDNRNPMGSDIVIRAVYEEEPAVALRNVLVNKYGEHIDTIKDSHGTNRLAVDGQFTAQVDVQVQVDIDGQYDPVNNPDPDDVGLIVSERNTSPGKPHQTQRLTAKPGTVNTDVVALDISLHDENGNDFTYLNPLPSNQTNDLVPENHDDLVLTRDPVTLALTQVQYKFQGNETAVLTLVRDPVTQVVTRVYRSDL